MSNIISALLLSFVVISTNIAYSSIALAVPPTTPTGEKTISGTICKVVKLFSGKVGHGIAAVAVVFLAISLFMGKMSWGVALVMGIGIGLIFGAEQIVSWISGDNSLAC
jgi:type IV secretion system protein VirB2